MAKKRRPIAPIELDTDKNDKTQSSVDAPLDTGDIRIEQKPIKKRAVKGKKQADALEYYSAPNAITKEVLERQKNRESQREARLRSKTKKEASKAANAEVDALIEGASNKKPSKKKNQGQAAPAEMEGQKKKRKPLRVALILVVAIGLIGFLGYRFVRADTILVEGNVHMPSEQVVALSGIKENTHILRINKTAAKKGIESDPHFIYEGVKYKFPNKVVIVVKERIEAVCLRFYNAYVITDEQGLILGHTEGEQPNLPLVKGLAVTDFTLGEVIKTEDTHKQETLMQILGQMHTFALTDSVSEIDITQANAVCLLLHNGTKVELGQPLELGKKMQLTASILEQYLLPNGLSGGTINVTATKAPTYRPSTEGEDVQIPEGVFNPGNKNVASPSPVPSTTDPMVSPTPSNT